MDIADLHSEFVDFNKLNECKTEVSASVSNIKDQLLTLEANVRNLKAEVEDLKGHVRQDFVNARNEVLDIKSGLRDLKNEVQELTSDVHSIRTGVQDMSVSLSVIATSMSKLADLPETWDKVKGFWFVISWLKSNIIPIAILIGIITFSFYSIIGPTKLFG